MVPRDPWTFLHWEWADENRNEGRTGKSSKNQLKVARARGLKGWGRVGLRRWRERAFKRKNPADLAAFRMWGLRDESKMTHRFEGESREK